MTDLTGKSVLITGGGTGVGAAMALAFADSGATVWISGRSIKRLQSVANKHEQISYVAADVTDENSVKNMFNQTGPCSIVIANAGASESASFVKTNFDAWQRMINVNLTGVFLTLRDGLRQMPETDGRLIAIASTAGLKGYAFVAPYAAAKHGVVGLVRSLALETASTDVTVNAICPGFLDTEMTERSVATIVQKTGKEEDDVISQLAGMNPQGRLIKPEEIAETALWLCSEGAKSVNGQAISISGGEV
jgi:3-hydroxybutyrate dehydrogenase